MWRKGDSCSQHLCWLPEVLYPGQLYTALFLLQLPSLIHLGYSRLRNSVSTPQILPTPSKDNPT
jgi:hypothetical protein